MYIDEPSIEGLMASLREMDVPPTHAFLLLIAEKNAPDLEALVAALRTTGRSFAGAIFPGVLADGQRRDTGVVALSVPLLHPPILIHGLGGPSPELPNILELVDGLADIKATAITLVDGLAPNIRGFLSKLYGQLGTAVSYLGGGAGSLSLEQMPCVFTEEGIFQDAALLMLSSLNVRLGVRHGWQRLAGPFAATRANGNTIEQLNWRPAFDVYREQVEQDAGIEFGPDNFFDIAKGYPFGLLKEGQEDVVRDPLLRTEAGALVCVGDVPENAVLSILWGSAETLIEAAAQAAEDALPPEGAKVHACLFMDCISRAIFLEDKFSQELQVIQDRLESGGLSLAPEGALTLGEVSSRGDGYLEFFNKTAVLGTLYDEGP